MTAQQVLRLLEERSFQLTVAILKPDVCSIPCARNVSPLRSSSSLTRLSP